MLTTTAGLPIARPPIEDRVLFVDTHCLDTTTVVSYEAENVTVLFLQSVCRVTNLSSPLIPVQPFVTITRNPGSLRQATWTLGEKEDLYLC